MNAILLTKKEIKQIMYASNMGELDRDNVKELCYVALKVLEAQESITNNRRR